MGRAKRIQGLAALLGGGFLAGCGVFGPATPAEAGRSPDAWRDLGLQCSGPTMGPDGSGLLRWSCHGRVADVFAEATIDSNEARVVDFFATIPAASQPAVAKAAFAAIVDGTDVLADARAAMHAWLLAWDGADASAGFGRATIHVQLDQTWYSLGITL